jgi:hypothetical protein
MLRYPNPNMPALDKAGRGAPANNRSMLNWEKTPLSKSELC